MTLSRFILRSGVQGIQRHHLLSSVSSLQPRRCFHAPPLALDAIVKLDLLQKETPERIQEIWTGYHSEKEHTVAEVWPAQEFEAFKVAVNAAGGLALFPVAREGGYFVLISQVGDDSKTCFFTYLEDYKQNPATAVPYLSVTIFTELLGEPSIDKDAACKDSEMSNGIALVRADLSPGLIDRTESRRLLSLLKLSYREKLLDIKCFNSGDSRFDFERHINDLLRH